ncbi:MAG: hypothetical protein LBC56_03410 [Oscillospiraceae bacterium]|nr:hypothetical protein [Oscillospiraceae bacterium]
MSVVLRVSVITIIAFLVGSALLLISRLSKQVRKVNLVMNIIGGLILMGCIVVVLVLVVYLTFGTLISFVLIPSM